MYLLNLKFSWIKIFYFIRFTAARWRHFALQTKLKSSEFTVFLVLNGQFFSSKIVQTEIPGISYAVRTFGQRQLHSSHFWHFKCQHSWFNRPIFISLSTPLAILVSNGALVLKWFYEEKKLRVRKEKLNQKIIHELFIIGSDPNSV